MGTNWCPVVPSIPDMTSPSPGIRSGDSDALRVGRPPEAGAAVSNPAGGTTEVNRLTAPQPQSLIFAELRTRSWSYSWSQLGWR